MATYRFLPLCAVLAVFSILTNPDAEGIVVDLTSAGSSGTINGAIYEQVDAQSTGTGTIESFVQIMGTGNAIESHAYNTTENNTLDNGSSDIFNHAITLNQVPVVDVNSTAYRQFLLDINENNNANLDQYLSLDEIQLFVAGTANSNVTTFTTDVLDHDGDLVYRMDAGEDSWVALNYALNTGSGSGDMLLYVPDALFSGYLGTDVVTLYSHFGGMGEDPDGFEGNFHTSAGFEEWATLTPAVVPEPTSITLLGLGLAGIIMRRTRRSALPGS